MRDLSQIRTLCTIFVGLLLLVGCGGGSGSGSGDNGEEKVALTVNFPRYKPTLFAYKDGAADWVSQSVTDSQVSVDLIDPNGAFDLLVIGLYLQNTVGYYYSGTVAEVNSLKFEFDETIDTRVDNVDLEVSGQFVDAIISMGTDVNAVPSFILPSSNPATVAFEQDADAPISGDVFFDVLSNGKLHYKLLRGNYDSDTFSYTVDAADADNFFSADVSAIRNDAAYIGLRNRYLGNNLKLDVSGFFNPGTDTQELDKFTALTPGLFQISAKWNFTDKSYVETPLHHFYRKSPTSLTFGKTPNRAPEVSFSVDADYSLRFDRATTYDAGIAGLSPVGVAVNTENADVEWYMYQTNGRAASSGLTFGLPKDVTGVAGFDPAYEPKDTDTIAYKFLFSNRDVQTELDYRNRGSEVDDSWDNMERLAVRLQLRL